jgi:hypothetical protein
MIICKLLASYSLRGLLVLLVISWKPMGATDQIDVPVEVQGTLTYSWQIDGYVPDVRRFTAQINDSIWLIRVYDDTSERRLYFEMGFDGEWIYRYDARTDNPDVINRFGNGYIRSGPFPDTDGGHLIQFIWIALASHNYFGSTEPGEPIHPLWPVDENDPPLVKGEFQLLDSPPYLPSYVTYFRESLGSGDASWREGEFEVVHEATSGEWTIPGKWTYTSYELTGEIELVVTGEVDQIIHPASDFTAVPQLDGQILVYDYRFKTLDRRINRALSYVVSDSIWPDIDQSPAYPAYQEALALLVTVEDERVSAIVIIVAGISLAAIPIVLIFVVRKLTIMKKESV